MIGMRVDVDTGRRSAPLGLTISSKVSVRNPEEPDTGVVNVSWKIASSPLSAFPDARESLNSPSSTLLTIGAGLPVAAVLTLVKTLGEVV